jgi:hypothetical protein
MPVFLGFAGLAFDGSIWFMERRWQQSNVDAAVMSAAYSHFNDGTDAQMLAAATASATDNNYTVGGDFTLVINSPPISGDFETLPNYVQATMSMPGEGWFSSAFGADPVIISTTATAGILSNGEACLVALHETADGAMSFGAQAQPLPIVALRRTRIVIHLLKQRVTNNSCKPGDFC